MDEQTQEEGDERGKELKTAQDWTHTLQEMG